MDGGRISLRLISPDSWLCAHFQGHNWVDTRIDTPSFDRRLGVSMRHHDAARSPGAPYVLSSGATSTVTKWHMALRPHTKAAPVRMKVVTTTAAISMFSMAELYHHGQACWCTYTPLVHYLTGERIRT